MLAVIAVIDREVPASMALSGLNARTRMPAGVQPVEEFAWRRDRTDAVVDDVDVQALRARAISRSLSCSPLNCTSSRM